MKATLITLAGILLLGIAGPASAAEEVANALSQVRQDIQTGLVELSALRGDIEIERQPLTGKMVSLEGEIAALDQQSRGVLDREQLREQRRGELERSVAGLEDQVAFIRAALLEYRRSLPTRLSVAEADAWSVGLSHLDETGVAVDASTNAAALPAYWAACLSFSRETTATALRGFSRVATVVAEDGRAVDGVVGVVGPVGWFVAAEGDLAGILVAREGSARAGLVVPEQAGTAEQVRLLTTGQPAALPLDVTGGRAALLHADERGLVDEVLTGGVVMIPLLAVAVLAVVVAVLKSISLWRIQGIESAAVVTIAELYRADDHAGALREAAALTPPLRAVVEEGLSHYAAAPAILEEIVEERVMSQVPALERHLWLLAVLAGIAPLLGLLGTVTGMIHTFQLVTVFGTGDAGLLSGGISEALVTTKFGLIIAIPVLVAHALLTRRVRTLMAQLEQAATAFVHALAPPSAAAEGSSRVAS